MAAEDGQSPADASQAFLQHLDKSGFFDQIGDLEDNLKTISGDLKILGEATVQRVHETESLVAHVLAVEAVLQILLKSHPIDPAAVRELVRARTAGVGDSAEGSAAVLSVVDQLLAKQGA